MQKLGSSKENQSSVIVQPTNKVEQGSEPWYYPTPINDFDD
jgi:hypothetical protein